MTIHHASGCPYEDYENAVMILEVKLESNETVSVGDVIRIELMDDSLIEREVKIINPKLAGDFYPVSEEVRKANWKKSKKPVLTVSGECSCSLIVLDCCPSDVKTRERMDAQALLDEMQGRFCLTPYKELDMGEESIFDHIDRSVSVPDRVILYLQTKEPYYVCPGIYAHPFQNTKQLLGPYAYTDGYYYWDRDTWKYVVKYGLVLPQQFIDYVMTDEASKFLEQQHNSDMHFAEQENVLDYLTKDSADIPLEKF